MIQPAYRHKLDDKQEKEFFCLPESGKGASCQQAKFRKSGDVAIYKFDKESVTIEGKKIEDPFVFLSKAPRVRAKCDYILFYPRETKKTKTILVVVCNLKSSTMGTNEDQLRAGSILAEYLIKNAIRLFNSENSNKPVLPWKETDFILKRVLFWDNKNTAKSPTKPGRPTDKYFIALGCNTGCCDLDAINLERD